MSHPIHCCTQLLHTTAAQRTSPLLPVVFARTDHGEGGEETSWRRAAKVTAQDAASLVLPERFPAQRV